MDIRPIRPGEHKLIGKIIGESFADDPIYQFLLGPQSAITAHATFMAKTVYLEKGFGHIADDHSGCTLWLPPSATAQLSLWQTLTMLPPLLRYSGLRRLIRALPAGDKIESHRPKEPHYYLFAIGTTRDGRRKGLGSKLIEAGLKIADETGMPAYLENSKDENMAFYQRHGFEKIGECFPAKGCPKERLMLRPIQ